MTALFLASPPVLVTAVAGLALFGALATALVGALEDPAHRVVAVVTFVVAAAGQPILGLGAAFWALVVGGVVMLWLRPWRRRAHPEEPPVPNSPDSGGSSTSRA